LKAQALDSLAESQRSNKHLEEAITVYQRVMSTTNVPDKLYLLAGRRAADRLRFRGFTGKSIKLLTEMSDKFPLDVDLKNQVAVGYLLIGQNKMSKKVLEDVLKIAPDSGVAKVHLGFILKTDDSNYEESIKYLSEGVASKEPGVIDGRFYFHLGDALYRTGKKEEALKVYEEAVKEGLFLSIYQRSLYNVNGLTGKPWWEPLTTRYAPDFKILEKNWVTIRDEALSLIDEKYSGFLPETEGLQEKGDWKQLELFARGRKIEKNCQKAPKTCALISQIPDAATCKRGQVKFSIMHPGTHVWAHTGPTNCRLRSHLGLVVPEGVSIRVAEETRKWEEGKVIVFDDSFEHEVWHNGSTYRLVLIVDFWHPELSAYQKRSLTPI
jgi:aspartate beta-hydroxylase